MRVLEIIADGYPGGGTTHILQILRGLRGSSLSLGLVTQSGSYLFNTARSLGIPCFGVNFFRSRLDVSVPLNLRHIVRDFRPQLVHVHGGRAAFFHSVARTKVPTVYTVHGYNFLEKSPHLVRRLALNAERIASQHADRVIFVSTHEARVAQNYNLLADSKHGVVVHNSVPLTEIPRARPSGTKHIGFVGRLEYQKDPLLFLEILKYLPLDYTATLVGGGALEDEVKVKIERLSLCKRVRMLGPLPYRETLEALSSLTTIIMTSRWEPFGLVAAEALAAGVPVVAPNIGGLNEVIETGRSGLLVDSRAPDQFARAVVQVTEDVELRQRIIESGRARAYSLFSEERMLSEIYKVYRQVADGEH